MHIVEWMLLATTVLSSGAWWRARGRVRHLESAVEAAQQRQFIDELALHRRSALDDLKNEFVSTVSHELRTPLTSIRGALGLLSSGLMGPMETKAQKLLRIALTNTDRLVRLINDILDLERMDAGSAPLQLRRCMLVELLQQAVDTMTAMADEAQVRLSLVGLENMPGIYFDADPDRILQVVTNLLSNAIKFSPAGAGVRIEVETPRDGLVLKVVDQGRGIPEKQLEAVFERFAQVDSADARRRGGTGLGLSICRKIIQQHGGDIWIEGNHPLQGVTVYVRLPRQQRSVDQEAGASALAAEQPVESSLTLCEGNSWPHAAVARPAHGFKRGSRHIGHEAGSSEEAAMGTADHSPGGPLQAILLDIHRLDHAGWEMLKRSARTAVAGNIPLVILSVLRPDGSGGANQVKCWLDQTFLKAEHRLAELGQALHSEGEMGHVLLVENDRTLAAVVLAGLEGTGVQVDHTRTRLQAMASCQRRRPDLILLDVTLPAGDGFWMVDWLRGQPELLAIPLVVYSGREMSDEERTRLRFGPERCLPETAVLTQGLEDPVTPLLQHRLRSATAVKTSAVT
jgi:signal transduction histidine kinase/response regulator of citrate/malate metabolism